MCALIQKNGIIYLMSKNLEESENDFNDKLKFIFKDFRNTKNEFESRLSLSKCYLNHKKLGVEYSKDIMDKINSYL